MSLLGQAPLGQRDVKPEKFGPQADLCHRTECAKCWWREKVSKAPRRWTMAGLPAYASLTDPMPMGGWKTDAHHEPPRSRGGTDADTLSLCSPCHRERHDTTAQVFWGFCDWALVLVIMRGRVNDAR